MQFLLKSLRLHKLLQILTKKSIKSVSKTSVPDDHLVRSVFAEGVINVNSFTSGTEYNVYANPIFIDPTVVSASGVSNIFNMKAGTTFDSVSIYSTPSESGTPFSTSSDVYTLDSLWIGVAYSQVPSSY